VGWRRSVPVYLSVTFALGSDVQQPPAMLAVDGVGVMARQAAVRALVSRVGGPENRLNEAQEKGHADQKYEDRQQPAGGALQRDVAETGGGRRGYGEL